MSDADTTYVRDEAGNVYAEDTAKDVAKAQQAGGSVVSQDDYQKAKLQKDYGDVGGQIGAAGAGALDALTFGFGSGIAGELGGDDWKQAIQGVEAANPWSYGAGMLVPALATGGVGGAGAAEEAGGSLLGRLGSGAVRGAVEGGLYGAGSQVSEDVLGHTDVTAEKVLSAIGHGVLLGGAAGGALDAVGGAPDALKGIRLRSGDVDALAEREFGTAAPGVGKALKAYAKASLAISGADAGTVEKLMSAENRPLRALLADGGEAFQDETARAIRQAGDDMMAANKLVTAEAKGELKASYVRDAVKTGNEEQTRAWALGQIDSLIGGAQETLDAGGGYTKAIEHASTAAYRAKAAIEDAMGHDANAQMFTALDGMKRDLQKLTRNSYQSLTRMADPIDQRAAKLTTEWLDKASSGFRDGLENEDLWGKAAADQKGINAAWTKQIDASNRFHAALTTDVGRDPTNPYMQMRGIDPGKASSYVRGIVNPDKDLTHGAVKDYIQSTKDLGAAIEKSYALPADAAQQVQKLNTAAGAFGDHIDRAEKAMTFINQVKALKGHSEGIGGHLATAGALLGGPVGALAGGAADALGNPAKQVERLAALERLQTKVTKRLGGIGDAIGSKGGGTPLSHQVTPNRAAFEASAKNLQRLASNPDEHQAIISHSLSSVADAAPKLVTAMAMRSQAMVSYLASQLPPGMAQQDGTLNPRWAKPLYTDAQMNDWRRLAAALHDPVGTLHQGIESGTLTPKEAAAVKQFYPNMYNEAVGRLQEHIANMDEPPPREKRLALATVLDVPTDLDLTHDVANALQGVYNATAPQGAPPEQRSGGPKQVTVNLTKGVSTPGQRVEGGR